MPALSPPPNGSADAAGRGAAIGRFELVADLPGDALAASFVALSRDRGERLVELVRLDDYVAEVSEFRNAFLREASTLRRLTHPRLLSFRVAEAASGSVFGVRDHVEKVSLRELAAAASDAGEELPPALIAHVAAEALEVLEAIHGIRGAAAEPLHGDVEPGQIHLTAGGRVLLTHSALSVAGARPGAARPPSPNERLGYKAPEQVTRQEGKPRRLDARCDIFAVGVVVWEVLAGARLFGEDTDEETIERVLDGPIPALDTVREAPLPEGLAAAVAQALKRDPAKRQPTAASFASALRAAAGTFAGSDLADAVERWAGTLLLERRHAVEESRREAEPDAPPASGPRAAGPTSDPAPPSEGESGPASLPAPDSVKVILNVPPSSRRPEADEAHRRRRMKTVKLSREERLLLPEAEPAARIEPAAQLELQAAAVPAQLVSLLRPGAASSNLLDDDDEEPELPRAPNTALLALLVAGVVIALASLLIVALRS